VTIKENVEAAGQAVAAYLLNVGTGESVANIHKGVIDTLKKRTQNPVKPCFVMFIPSRYCLIKATTRNMQIFVFWSSAVGQQRT